MSTQNVLEQIHPQSSTCGLNSGHGTCRVQVDRLSALSTKTDESVHWTMLPFNRFICGQPRRQVYYSSTSASLVKLYDASSGGQITCRGKLNLPHRPQVPAA